MRNVNRSPTPLEVSEVTEGEKFVPVQSFTSQVDKLTGQFARLKPFKDEEDLRVGGRVKHSDLQYDVKYPIILPENTQLRR